MPLESRHLEPQPFGSTPVSDPRRRSIEALKFPQCKDLSESDAPVHSPQNAFGLKDPSEGFREARLTERFCVANLAALRSKNDVRDLEYEIKVSAEAEMQRSGADDVTDRVANLTKTVTDLGKVRFSGVRPLLSQNILWRC